MKIRRVLKWSLGLTLLAIPAISGVLYLLASSTPGDYEPVALSEEQKTVAREAMENKLSVMFDPSALLSGDAENLQGVENVHSEEIVVVDEETGQSKVMIKTTFDMPLSSKELNRWISSMPTASMDRLKNSGVSSPAISLSKDRLTFYAHVDEFDKVVAMDMGFKFNQDESVVLDLKSSKVGKLLLPDGVVDEYKEKLVQQAGGNVGPMSRKAGERVGGETGKIASAVVTGLGPKMGAALGGRPVTLDFNRGGASVRIRGVKAVDGKMTLDIVSLVEKGAPPAGMPDVRSAAVAAVAAADPAAVARAKQIADAADE